MITLKQIAALAIDQQSSGDPAKDSRISYQVLIPRIRLLLNDFIKPMVFERYNDDDKSAVSNFIVSYELTLNPDTLGSFVDLSENYISLPHNRGVHRVIHRIPSLTMPGQYVDNECYPTTNASINRNTRAGRYPTNKKYYLEGKRIRFQNISIEPGQTNKAIVQIITAAPDIYGDNDLLPLSPDMVSQMLLKLNSFSYQVPQDKINNSSPNT